jgi:hypothetical protein
MPKHNSNKTNKQINGARNLPTLYLGALLLRKYEHKLWHSDGNHIRRGKSHFSGALAKKHNGTVSRIHTQVKM